MADLMINVVRRYRYETLKREDLPEGRRYVNRYGEALPSVTTILEKTKDKSKLIEWVNRVGEEEAERVRTSAANVGTSMHAFIESHIKNRPITPAKYLWQAKAYRMAAGLMEQYFGDLDEVWGNEVMVYRRGLYAGTTDLAGKFRGQDSIVDFKQTNKMKKREWIEDYFVQLVAYASAHNEMYNTRIRQGVILMASQDGQFQDFILCGREFDHYLDLWNTKVADTVGGGGVVPQSPAETGEQTQNTEPHSAEQASAEGSEQVQTDLEMGSEQEQQPETAPVEQPEEFEAWLREQK
jgi:genome maintenance exonuclease 1